MPGAGAARPGGSLPQDFTSRPGSPRLPAPMGGPGLPSWSARGVRLGSEAAPLARLRKHKPDQRLLTRISERRFAEDGVGSEKATGVAPVCRLLGKPVPTPVLQVGPPPKRRAEPLRRARSALLCPQPGRVVLESQLAAELFAVGLPITGQEEYPRSRGAGQPRPVG
jgi:hypothetical protein